MKRLFAGFLFLFAFTIMAANVPGVQDGNTVVKPLSQDQATRLIALWGVSYGFYDFKEWD